MDFLLLLLSNHLLSSYTHGYQIPMEKNITILVCFYPATQIQNIMIIYGVHESLGSSFIRRHSIPKTSSLVTNNPFQLNIVLEISILSHKFSIFYRILVDPLFSIKLSWPDTCCFCVWDLYESPYFSLCCLYCSSTLKLVWVW